MTSFRALDLKPSKRHARRLAAHALATIPSLEARGRPALPELYTVFRSARRFDVKLAAARAIARVEHPPQQD